MNANERRKLLEDEVENGNLVELKELVEQTARRFEVKTYRKEKFPLLTLANIVHKVLEDRQSTSETVKALQTHLGVKLEYFAKLRLAHGWASFTSPTTGNLIEALEGDAQLTRDLLMVIENKMGYFPPEGKYSSITQEALDKRNSVAVAAAIETTKADNNYQSFLQKFDV